MIFVYSNMCLYNICRPLALRANITISIVKTLIFKYNETNHISAMYRLCIYIYIYTNINLYNIMFIYYLYIMFI